MSCALPSGIHIYDGPNVAVSWTFQGRFPAPRIRGNNCRSHTGASVKSRDCRAGRRARGVSSRRCTYGKSARRPKHNSSRCYVNCDLDALRVETVAARQGPYVGRDVGRAGRCQLKGLEADGTLIAGPLVELIAAHRGGGARRELGPGSGLGLGLGLGFRVVRRAELGWLGRWVLPPGAACIYVSCSSVMPISTERHRSANEARGLKGTRTQQDVASRLLVASVGCGPHAFVPCGSADWAGFRNSRDSRCCRQPSSRWADSSSMDAHCRSGGPV